MAAVAICEDCKNGNHAQCTKVIASASVADQNEITLVGTFCVCPHDATYQTADEVWARRNHKPSTK